MIELGGLRTKTRLNVQKTFTPGQLRKSETTKLIEAGEMLDFVIATIPRYATAKNMPRQVVHYLRKNILACENVASAIK
jgi:hypothetical protein